MSAQRDRAALFGRLHVRGNPLVLFNIWDAGSALIVARAGARAIATGSWSVAAAHGYGDGEQLPLESLLAAVREIVRAVDLPVTVDFETGYGSTPEMVGESVVRVIDAGVVGINLEDQVLGEGRIRPVGEAAARVRAARRAADGAGVPVFLNARTDLFLRSDRAAHDDSMLDDALRRAAAYAEAGASGFFAPGLFDEAAIGRLCAASPLPVNILALPGAPSARRLAELGVARISHGPGPYRRTADFLETAARQAFTTELRGSA